MTKSDMKYFYTDPLAAAWMAKHFWMAFITRDAWELFQLEERWRYKTSLALFQGKFYIHPDSVKLLEPQPEDCVEECFGCF